MQNNDMVSVSVWVPWSAETEKLEMLGDVDYLNNAVDTSEYFLFV